MPEFVKFPKIPRWSAECVTITEKIDGTNAAIAFDSGDITCQSRSRIITPDDDNFGFARWAYDNAAELYDVLGDGLHFGEWWGQGIQRRYGMITKAFSLFNTHRWAGLSVVVGGCPVAAVPVIWTELPLGAVNVQSDIDDLKACGSLAAPGFMDPEGLMLYLHETGKYLKVPFKAEPKGRAA